MHCHKYRTFEVQNTQNTFADKHIKPKLHDQDRNICPIYCPCLLEFVVLLFFSLAYIMPGLGPLLFKAGSKQSGGTRTSCSYLFIPQQRAWIAFWVSSLPLLPQAQAVLQGCEVCASKQLSGSGHLHPLIWLPGAGRMAAPVLASCEITSQLPPHAWTSLPVRKWNCCFWSSKKELNKATDMHHKVAVQSIHIFCCPTLWL